MTVARIDFDYDERSTLDVKIIVRKPRVPPATIGELRDISGASIEWNCTHNDVVQVTKSTDDATITLGDPDAGVISDFSFTILKTDIDLPSTATYGVAVIYKHEARITLTSSEYVTIRGKMFVWPSQT